MVDDEQNDVEDDADTEDSMLSDAEGDVDNDTRGDFEADSEPVADTVLFGLREALAVTDFERVGDVLRVT